MTAQLARAGGLGMAFLYNIFLIRTLAVTEAGDFLTLVLFVTGAGMIGRVGTDLFILSADTRWHSLASITRIYRVAVVGCLASGLLFVSTVPLLRPETSEGRQFETLVAILAPTILLQSLSILDAAVLRTHRRFVTGALAEVGLVQGLAGLGTLAFYLSNSFALDVVAAAKIYLISAAATAVVSWFWRRRYARISLPIFMSVRSSDKAPPQQLQLPLTELTRLAAMSIMLFMWSWIPAMLSWLVAGPAASAVVIAATRLVAFIPLYQSTQTNALMPQVARWRHQQEIGTANIAIRRAYRQTVGVGGLVCVAYLLGAGPLIAATGLESGETVLQAMAVCSTLMLAFGLVIPLSSVTAQSATVLRGLAVGFPPTLGVAWFALDRLGLVWGVVGINALLLITLITCARQVQARTGLLLRAS